MKQLFVFIVMLSSASMLSAQDIITLRTGETIDGKVSEVGINEVKYYKYSNLQGPVYVAAKADVSQILYENGSRDVFTTTQPAVTVAVQQPVRRRSFWNSGWLYPVVSTHIDLGHHGSYYGGHHDSYFGGHHGGHH